MEARLPDNKLGKLKDKVVQWVTYKKATKRVILSLMGSLQQATKVVRFGSLPFPHVRNSSKAEGDALFY